MFSVDNAKTMYRTAIECEEFFGVHSALSDMTESNFVWNLLLNQDDAIQIIINRVNTVSPLTAWSELIVALDEDIEGYAEDVNEDRTIKEIKRAALELAVDEYLTKKGKV